jgi:enoyl-CoA hydratase
MSEASEVLVSRDGAVVTLTINRPRAKNSLNRAVFDGLPHSLRNCATTMPCARSSSPAPRACLRGADITAFEVLRAAPLLGDRSATGWDFFAALERFPSPSSQRWKSSRWAAARNWRWPATS